MDIINKLEYSFELVIVILIVLVLVYNTTIFEEIFPPNTIVNYNSRIWHLLLLLIVLTSYLWSNKIGILLSGLYIMYILDMEILVAKNI